MCICMIRRAMRPAMKPRMIDQMMCNIGSVGWRDFAFGAIEIADARSYISFTHFCRLLYRTQQHQASGWGSGMSPRTALAVEELAIRYADFGDDDSK